MVHRFRILISVICLTALSNIAHGLGLGEVTVLSKLNQPLDAHVALLEVRDLEKNEILIGLASKEEFDRVGIDRPYFLTDLTFKVIMNANGDPYISIKSKKLVREPFLNFLVQVQWPSGKILREYTLLLDLPVFTQKRPATVNPATSVQTIPPTQQAAPVPQLNTRSSFDQGRKARPAPDAPAQSVSRNTYAGGETTAPVGDNQTLWEIALDVRPNNSFSVQQTMLAIQELNPNAFINNNINLLKRGQVLRVPTEQQIREFTKRDAVSAVAQQNAQWSGEANEYGAQLSAQSADDVSTQSTAPTGGQLRLVSPDSSSESNAGKSSGSGNSQNEALENELAVTLEELERSKRDNSDLRSKVESLEDQIQTLESLIEVTNEDMRALELAARKNKEAAEEAANTPAVNEVAEVDQQETEEPVAEEPVVKANPLEKDVAEIDSVISEKDLEVAEAPEEVVKPKPAPIKKAKPKSIIDFLIDYIIYIAIALIVIIGGIVYWLQSRDDDEDDEEDYLPQSEDFVMPDDHHDEELIEEDADTTVIQNKGEDDVDLPEQEEPSIEAQTADAASESEIYISLGQYDQAEDILVNALNHDDDNQSARLKLLEVYAAQNAANKFDEQFAKIYTHGDAESIERAQTLRNSIEGIGEFDPEQSALEPIQESVDLELDTDSSLDLREDFKEGPSEELSEDDFTLDLDDNESTEDDLSLDFDLGEQSDEPTSSFDELDKTDDLQETTDDLSLDLEDLTLDTSGLDFDEDELTLDLSDGDEDSSESESLESLTEIETAEAPVVTSEDLGDSIDLSAESPESSISDELDDALDFDLGELDLDDTKDAVSLEDDIAALDAELDLSELDEETTALSNDLSGIDDTLSLDEKSSVQPEGLVDINDELASDVDLSTYNSDQDDEFSLLDEDLELDDSAEQDNTDSDEELSITGEELQDNAAASQVIDAVDDLSEVDDASASLETLDTELDALDVDLGDGEQAEEIQVEELAPLLDAVTEEPEQGLDIASDDQEETTTLSEEPTEQSNDLLEEDALDLTEELNELDKLSIDTLAPMEEPVTDFGEFEDLDDADETEITADEDAQEIGDDTLFTQAISEIPDEEVEFDLLEDEHEPSDSDDLGFINDSDEIATKLDLARAYIDMGDREGAKDIIDEIQKEGNDQQKEEADKLLARLEG